MFVTSLVLNYQYVLSAIDSMELCEAAVKIKRKLRNKIAMITKNTNNNKSQRSINTKTTKSRHHGVLRGRCPLLR